MFFRQNKFLFEILKIFAFLKISTESFNEKNLWLSMTQWARKRIRNVRYMSDYMLCFQLRYVNVYEEGKNF